MAGKETACGVSRTFVSVSYALIIRSVQSLGCVWLFVTHWTVARQVSLSIPNSWSMLELMSIESVMQQPHPLSSPSPPAFDLSQHQGLFQWIGSSLTQAAQVLEFQLQHQSFQWIFSTDFLKDWLVGSPWSPRDSQESSPISKFKSINSLVLSFLYSPTFTSIHDYWKNHDFD